MGKRSDFPRRERDFYPTPKAAVAPLLKHLPPTSSFAELCAGDGALRDHLEDAGHYCFFACDIHPKALGIHEADATTDIEAVDIAYCDFIITNPPWSRPILHRMIPLFASWKPTWLLFDADWVHTKQSRPFLPYLHKIVSVGRVKWIENSKHTGKDNVCWYLFDSCRWQPPEFHT